MKAKAFVALVVHVPLLKNFSVWEFCHFQNQPDIILYEILFLIHDNARDLEFG